MKYKNEIKQDLVSFNVFGFSDVSLSYVSRDEMIQRWPRLRSGRQEKSALRWTGREGEKSARGDRNCIKWCIQNYYGI